MQFLVMSIGLIVASNCAGFMPPPVPVPPPPSVEASTPPPLPEVTSPTEHALRRTSEARIALMGTIAAYTCKSRHIRTRDRTPVVSAACTNDVASRDPG